MHLSTLLSASLMAMTATAAAVCTADVRRQGLRSLITAFIDGTDENIDAVPLSDNVTSILQTQGIRVILGRNLEGAKRAIKIVNTIVTDFGPAPYDLASYLDNGVNQAYVNGTADIGLTLGDVSVPLIGRAPATQDMKYDLTSCKAYEAVGTVEPVNGVIQRALEALLLQNFPLDKVLDATPL